MFFILNILSPEDKIAGIWTIASKSNMIPMIKKHFFKANQLFMVTNGIRDKYNKT